MFRLVDVESLDLGALFRHSPNAYVIFDAELTILGCNDAYLKAVGRARGEDIVGRNVFEAFPSAAGSSSYQLLRRSLERVIATHKQDHIAVIPYDTSGPGEPANMRYWSATHTPVFDAVGRFRYILQHTVDITELQRLRERTAQGQIAEAGVLQRAREVQAANLEISAERELLKDMFRQAPGFTGILAGPAHTFILANDAYVRLAGGRALVGLSVADALPEMVGQGFIDILDEVYRTGVPYVGESVAVALHNEPDALPRRRFVDFVYQPIFADDGSVSGIFVQGHDVTDKVEMERLQALQRRELGHRLKNQLSMVQAIVNQTLRSTPDTDAASEAIGARLLAMAGAHNSLVAGQAGQTTVEAIVRTAVAPHHDDRSPRFDLAGPDMEIASRPALSLSLILHELSTNAVKYGALSNEEGRVSIKWGVREGTEGRAFFLSWREAGGPPVAEPKRTGTGTRLIRAGLSGTAMSQVEVTFRPEGVQCEVSADLASFQTDT